MNLTTNLGLGKPLGGEDYDIDVANANMDTLDAAVGDAIDDILDKRLGGKEIGYKVIASPGNTDANGYRIYTHNIGFIPIVVLATSFGPSSSFAAVWGIDSLTLTTFRARFMFTSAADQGPYLNLPAPALMCFFGE